MRKKYAVPEAKAAQKASVPRREAARNVEQVPKHTPPDQDAKTKGKPTKVDPSSTPTKPP